MNQQTPDQGWQQLQSHIGGFFSQTLRNDVQRIEYKPRFTVQLLEMKSECRQFLKPGEAPEAVFPTEASAMTVRAYCNLHALWKA